MSERTYIDYITDIAEELERIEKFVEGLSYDEFRKDVRNRYPQIPWKRIAGVRDKLIHRYFGVDHEILWKTIKKRIPEVKP